MKKTVQKFIGDAVRDAMKVGAGEAAMNIASQKRSITLYQMDLDILDEIRNNLRCHGVRNLSDSEALRLACRMVSFDARLLKSYEAMKLEDGRSV